MPAVLLQEFLNIEPLGSNVLERVVHVIEEQKNFRRPVGLGSYSIECLKGKNLSGLVIVQQRKVPHLETGNGFARLVGDHNIQLDGPRRVR